MIRGWFRTTAALTREFDKLRTRVAELGAELEEARDEAVELATERDDLRERLALATRTARLAREGVKLWNAIDPRRRPLTTPERAELLLLRHTHRELEKRLAILQQANMDKDVAECSA
ncbi:hypothetical protein ACQPYK_08685 [Streptosporangium sp. CA-135522]|uniref:hypothetical protein n=1 Tax=Streptosporangium sp. CA-135522 TaxID=3240072 RepID=UPI003D8F7362